MDETTQTAIDRLIEGNRWRIETWRDEVADPGPGHDDQARILALLRAHYTADPIPACPVCGRDLTIGRMGGGDATTYACPNSGIIGSKTPEERSAAHDHYARSQFRHVRPGDSTVLALLDVVDAVLAQQVTA